MHKPQKYKSAPLSRQQLRFLNLYEKKAFISPCAEQIGVRRETVLTWRNESSLFAQEMDRAKDVFHNKMLKSALADLCCFAQRGDRQSAQLIRNIFGKEALNEVMRGKILNWGGELP